MARYYFEIREGAEFVRDDEGSEYDSLEAAVQGAARSAPRSCCTDTTRGGRSAECGVCASTVRRRHHVRGPATRGAGRLPAIHNAES